MVGGGCKFALAPYHTPVYLVQCVMARTVGEVEPAVDGEEIEVGELDEYELLDTAFEIAIQMDSGELRRKFDRVVKYAREAMNQVCL
jgi:hypothetical protein